jgi:hypothetical protein
VPPRGVAELVTPKAVGDRRELELRQASVVWSQIQAFDEKTTILGVLAVLRVPALFLRHREHYLLRIR